MDATEEKQIAEQIHWSRYLVPKYGFCKEMVDF